MRGDVSKGLSEEVCRQCHDKAGYGWTLDDDIRWAREMYVICPHPGSDCPYLVEHILRNQAPITKGERHE